MGEKTYIGIADAHGIESIIPEESADSHRKFVFSFRANANRQRHAVSYAVTLDDEGFAKVEEQIKAGNFVNALHVLKLRAKEVRVESTQHEKSWHMIPNPDLDPYYSTEK